MVWPILVVIGIVIIIGIWLYKKDEGSRGFPLNRFCLACHKRFPENLSNCPYCGEVYFNFNQK